jgi:chromate reductase
MHPLNRPEVFCNAFTDSFDKDDDIVDEKIRKLIIDLLEALKNSALKI